MSATTAPAPIASTRHTVNFFLLSLGIATISFLRAHGRTGVAAGNRFPLYFALIAMELLLVWFVRSGIRARAGTLRTLLGGTWHSWRETGRDMLLAAGVVIVLIAASSLLFVILGGWRSNTAWLLPRTVPDKLLWLLVAATAGVCEELVYRGYLQRQLWSWTGTVVVAVALQAAIFGAAHFYQGAKSALIAGVYGLILGLVAAWRRSLLPGAIAHAWVDMVGGFAG